MGLGELEGLEGMVVVVEGSLEGALEGMVVLEDVLEGVEVFGIFVVCVMAWELGGTGLCCVVLRDELVSW